MKLLIVVLLLPFIAKSQSVFSGKVVDQSTRDPVAYASVGLMKENTGTNADEDGRFMLLSSSEKNNDTLIISSIGYKILKIPVDRNKISELNFGLEKQELILKEVLVTNKSSWIFSTLNDFKQCGNHFVGTSGYHTQMAQHFQAPAENAILTEIKICRMSFGMMYPEKTMFRIRIYDIDSVTKAPSSDLCTDIIEVKTKNKVIKLDLKKYRIRIPNKDFFVAIEWMKIPYNEKILKREINGVLSEYISYKPSIGWTDNNSPSMEAWALDYKNNWKPMFTFRDRTNISISATIKY